MHSLLQNLWLTKKIFTKTNEIKHTLDLTPSEEISSVLAELVDAEAGSITSRSRKILDIQTDR